MNTPSRFGFSLLAPFLLSLPASAQLYWGTSPATQQWDADSLNWTATDGSAASAAWGASTGAANFKTGGGTIALAADFSPSALTFGGGGAWTLSASSARTLTTSAATTFLTVDASTQATIGANITIASVAAAQVTGAGTLLVQGTISCTGGANNLQVTQIGQMTLETGGTLFAGNSLILGTSGASTITVAGGTLQAGNGTSNNGNIVLANGAGSTTTLNVNSGLVLAKNTSSPASTRNVLRFGSTTANTASTGTVNLNGGTIEVARIYKGNTAASSTFNFNGGTVKISASIVAAQQTAFLTGLDRANIRDGGAIVDTNGKDVTIGQPLEHSNIGGDAAIDGGLTKLGAGTLTLTGVNTFTGKTDIQAGKLALGSGEASATFLADTTSLYLYTTNASGLVLNFANNTVMESISGLYVDGIAQSAGTWGAIGSGAQFQSALITGTGLLNVTSSSIPEPSTAALLLGLGAGFTALSRRRRHRS